MSTKKTVSRITSKKATSAGRVSRKESVDRVVGFAINPKVTSGQFTTPKLGSRRSLRSRAVEASADYEIFSGAEKVEIDPDRPIGELVGDFVILVLEGDDEAVAVGMDDIVELLRFRELNSERFERAIEGMMPVLVPPPEDMEQARRNAELRARFLSEIACYTSEEVAELAGSKAANRAQRASRFKREQRVFSVVHGGQNLFPAFQFDADLQPKKVIADVLSELHNRGLSGWEVALWFVTNSSFLGGKRPLDLLDDDPSLVVRAATRRAPW